METLTPAVGPILRNEPIPGYVLRERLGSGGYGEVWEAEAPGGLRKAVKFIYGRLDEARAQGELKSLNRIKEIGHPFLLSIERIEVVDGRLMIVTELAQGCLKNRYNKCRQAGLAGIPRDELLGYIRDAADALDFIHDRHGLQHLDIKPENLLIVGNHIKVADFGLLKDLGETLSSVGGLTALYCPPEALNGRPSRHSDQYSLAIVYQEMLTGQFPFGGRTAAQLAAQHLHSPPMLAALPPTDQPVVARALSKNPDQRFTNCRTFADTLGELGEPRSTSARRAAPAFRRSVPRSPSAKTEVLNAPGSPGTKAAPIVDVRPTPAEIRDLPRIDLTSTKSSFRPTVLIGLGGTGGRILSQLQLRLSTHFGDPDVIPALQMLLLDTDSRDLSSTIFKRGGFSIPVQSTLALPLRAPKDYRADSKRHLEWLSRRWLYNIPRSLQTEGLRPIGRLAFVDHAPKIFDRLQRVLQNATSAESIEHTRQLTKLDFAPDAPNVFVVASIAGGTGSGIALDLGYAVRKVLAELQLPDQRVFGILTHATSRKAASRDLAVVNTLAALQELRQFGARHGYFPGDPACDLPAFYENPSPFHETYFVHLGSELGNGEFESAVDQVAEYLFQNTLGPAAPFFEASRRAAENPAEENSLAADRLRTFGVAVFDPPSGEPEAKPTSPTPSPEMPHETQNNLDDTQHLMTGGPSVAEKCRAATPQLGACGGARRTLIVAPSNVDRERLARANQGIPAESFTFAEHSRNEVVVCQEIAEVPINRVVTQLVGSRRDYPELADRLHTRIDIEWPSLCLGGTD
jgi:serine/threonine protein kinase